MSSILQDYSLARTRAGNSAHANTLLDHFVLSFLVPQVTALNAAGLNLFVFARANALCIAGGERGGDDDMLLEQHLRQSR